MKTFFILPTQVLLSLLLATAACADEIVYVQPFQAKVFAKPAISAEVLGKVDSGYQFTATGREGSWLKLIFNGKQGFIPAVQTAKSPPLNKSAAYATEPTQKLGSRARSSTTVAVVAGMKGLTYEDRSRITKGEQSNMTALEKIEALKITPKELEQFQAEGGTR